MSTTLNMTMTDAGNAALWNATSTGVDLALTHVQLGSGNKVPDSSEIALIAAQQHVAIKSGTVVNASQIRIRALFSGASAYPVSEIGIWAGEPGTEGAVLFAYWSQEAGQLLEKASGIDFVFVHDLAIASTVDGGSITVVADDGQSVALTLISEHEMAGNPHPQYVTHDEAIAYSIALGG